MGFRDGPVDPEPSRDRDFQYSLRIVGFRDYYATLVFPCPRRSFSIPCESWGSATPRICIRDACDARPFSIPCESWGSATSFWIGCRVGRYSFQYSLRIVGFRDIYGIRGYHNGVEAFSIPCESWGSATGLDPGRYCFSQTSFSIPCESWGSATIRKLIM